MFDFNHIYHKNQTNDGLWLVDSVLKLISIKYCSLKVWQTLLISLLAIYSFEDSYELHIDIYINHCIIVFIATVYTML
jgi:hypothetical protein